MASPIVLVHNLAPGDIVVMSALVRDLALTFPGRFDIHVYTSCTTLWDNNPYIAQAWKTMPPDMPAYTLKYQPMITAADRLQLHFLTAYHRSFEEQTKIKVPLLLPKGDLHLTEKERDESPVSGRYWIVINGGKSDFTNKVWSGLRMQQVVDRLRDYGIRCVQCGATAHGNWHMPLSNVLDLIGKTNLRELLWLIQHADGVICPVTAAMHMAAALDRPCVCIAGGREHWWWEAYVNVQGVDHFGPIASGKVRAPHRFLHTQTLFDCCSTKGCWLNKILRSQPDSHQSYCKRPTEDGYGQAIPQCMAAITVDHVVDAVLSYYQDGTHVHASDTPHL
jgi:ADP-heptose:LPS heptosyltransferase